MYDLEQAAAVAGSAAVEAGRIIRSGLGNTTILGTKEGNPRDLVTRVDHDAQTRIAEVLRREYPDIPIIGEEGSTGTDCTNLAQLPFAWSVDPNDGTTNLAHGIPHCCASIALTANGRPVVGVIYDPFLDELFVAVRGLYARCNGQPIRVWDDDGSLDEQVVGTGFTNSRRWREVSLKAAARICPLVRSLRAFGSSALSLAWVACGRLAASWRFNQSPWDTTAGIALVREAGGRVESIYPSETLLSPRHAILASSPPFYEDLLREIRTSTDDRA